MPAGWLYRQSVGGKVREGLLRYPNDLPDKGLIISEQRQQALFPFLVCAPLHRFSGRCLRLHIIGKPVNVARWTHVIAEKGTLTKDEVGGLRRRRQLQAIGVPTSIHQASVDRAREGRVDELSRP